MVRGKYPKQRQYQAIDSDLEAENLKILILQSRLHPDLTQTDAGRISITGLPMLPAK